MSDINKCTFSGRLAAEPELKAITNGHLMAFRLAVSTWNGKENKTEWLNFTMFGKRTEKLAQMLSKGDGVFVIARLQTDEYEKDGQKVYRTKFIVDELVVGSKKYTGEGEASGGDDTSGGPNF